MLAQALDTVQTFEVADAILRHGVLPFVDAGEERRGAQAENLLRFISNDGDDGVIGKLPDVFGIRSGEGAAEDGAIFGGAVREFVVNEGRGEQLLAFAARHEEAEAGRKRPPDATIIAEANGD